MLHKIGNTRLTLCPCGFGCLACLIMDIRVEGLTKGIFWNIIFHSTFGLLWAKNEVKNL